MPFTFETDAKFLGIKTCQNQEYSNLLLVIPESYKGVPIPLESQPSANARCLVKTAEIGQYANLKPGDKYRIRLAVSMSPGRGNYKPSIQFDLLQVQQKNG